MYKKISVCILTLCKYITYIVTNTIAGSFLCPIVVRRFIYRCFGHKVSTVYANCFIGYGPGKLTVGENSYCNYRCFFDLGNDIIIGDNCAIAFNVTFINSTHVLGSHKRRAGQGISRKIVVGNGCWIGANTTIMPGVTIGDGCIIGAGSLILQDCKSDSLYVGVPAKFVKELKL